MTAGRDEQMNTQLLMDTAMLAGELLLRSGAETYRVEDTMLHILNHTENMEIAEILVLLTGISATVKAEGGETVTVIKRVGNRGVNLNRMVEVNSISRRYCGGEITLDEAYRDLKAIQEKRFAPRTYVIALMAACPGFALFFGGGIWEVVASACVGAMLTLCNYIGGRLRFNMLFLNIFNMTGVATASIFMKLLLGGLINIDVVMIAGIMPLVPGLAITNAIRDTIKGDYLSGSARMMEAFLTAVGLALGIAFGIVIFGGLLKGGIA